MSDQKRSKYQDAKRVQPFPEREMICPTNFYKQEFFSTLISIRQLWSQEAEPKHVAPLGTVGSPCHASDVSILSPGSNGSNMIQLPWILIGGVQDNTLGDSLIWRASCCLIPRYQQLRGNTFEGELKMSKSFRLRSPHFRPPAYLGW